MDHHDHGAPLLLLSPAHVKGWSMNSFTASLGLVLLAVLAEFVLLVRYPESLAPSHVDQ